MSKRKIAGLQELIPWMCPVTEALVLQKDGSLLANFKISGIDIDHKNEETVDAARDALDRACTPFGSGITAFWRVDHRKTKASIDSHISNDIAKMVDDVHMRSLSGGKYYENSHYLSLLSTPQKGLDRYFAKIGLHVENGKSLVKAMFQAAKESIFVGNNYAHSLEQTKREIKQFESLINGFEGAAPLLKMKRLKLTEQYSFLHETANPAVPPRKVQFPESLMDALLSENYFTAGADKLLFSSRHGKKYVSAIAIKEIPQFTKSGMLDAVLKLDAEVSFCLMFKFLDKNIAHKIIKGIERHYRFTQFNLRNIVKMMMKSEEEVDTGRLQIATEAQDALRRVTAENLQFGYANGTILCYGDTQDECDAATLLVVKVLNKEGFGAYIEDFNATASFASTLPGQWGEQERLQLISTPNISDLAPIMTTWKGHDSNSWFSDQTGVTQPPLTILPSSYNTLTKVNFHVSGGSGHVMVVGPTGAGKSIWMNFLTYQTDRYKPRRYTFDRDRSCRISTILNGGAFIDITGKYETATKINPLCLLSNDRHLNYVGDWVQLAIESYGKYECTADDTKLIASAIHTLQAYGSESHRLLNLIGLLPEHLKIQLEPWVEGGKEARFFDHIEDAFQLTDEVCIEMGDLMDNHPKAAALAIDYFFYRIADGLSEGDARPTYIKIEEGSFFITHPIFSKRLNAATVTIRKKNGSIWLGTQSLQQIKKSPDFLILQENFKNKIFLPNEAANKELYMDVFGLTSVQFKQIKEGTVNRDYLWVNPEISRLFQMRFPREIVAVTRSDERAQNTFDQCYRNRDADQHWKKTYCREVLSESN